MIGWQIIITQLKSALVRQEEKLDKHRELENETGISRIKVQLEIAQVALDRLNSSFSRLKRIYLNGDITDEEYDFERKNQAKKLEEANNEFRKLQIRFTKLSQETEEERKKRFSYFMKNFSFDTIDENKGNELLKTIIEKITYKHTGDSIKLRFEWM